MKKNKVKAEFLFKKGMKSELAMGIKRLYWGLKNHQRRKHLGKERERPGRSARGVWERSKTEKDRTRAAVVRTCGRCLTDGRKL